jgi:hypothetical protein
MKRLELLAGLCPVAVVPLASVQQPGELYLVAIFHPTHPVSAITEHAGLRTLFVELRR